MDDTTTAASELLATMAVVAAGAMVGRIEFRGLRLDLAALLLVGAAVAHLGVRLSPALGLFGLLLFLYAVGVKSGPALRNMHRRELGLAMVGLAMVLGLLGASLLLGLLLGLPTPVTLGAFCGFFGSGAALALVEGAAPGGEASAGFAIATPVSALLIMLLVQVWRARASSGIQSELASWNRSMSKQPERPSIAEIEVEQPAVTGKSLRELRLGCQVLWVRRGRESFAAEPATVLQRGDVLHVSCPHAKLDREVARIGRAAPVPHETGHSPIVVRKFFVSNPSAIEVRLDRLLLRERYGATVTRVRRAGMDLRARSGFRFRFGDRVQVSAPADKAESLRALFGDDAHGLEEFAFPRAALVIFVGGLLGAIPIHLAGSESLRLGPALGVLVASLVAAALHRTGPMVWTQSGPTARLMSQLGLTLFLAQVGNESYPGLMSAWGEHGAELVALAVLPVVLIGLLAYAAGKLLPFGPLTVLSLIPSVALNTPALAALQDRYRERIPGHVYAAVYPMTALGLLAVIFALSLLL